MIQQSIAPKPEREKNIFSCCYITQTHIVTRNVCCHNKKNFLSCYNGTRFMFYGAILL